MRRPNAERRVEPPVPARALPIALALAAGLIPGVSARAAEPPRPAAPAPQMQLQPQVQPQQVQAQPQVQAQVQAQAPAQPQPYRRPEPLFRIDGYEQRYEYIQDAAEWKRTLGPARYRMSIASKVLMIVGGGAAFGGLCALLVGFGNLAGATDYGRMPAGYGNIEFDKFTYGFTGMAAAGGAMLAAGIIMTIPLPPRHQEVRVPRYVPVTQPAPAPVFGR